MILSRRMCRVKSVSPVEVHGADQGFEGISLERTIDIAGTGIEPDELIETEFLRKFVELHTADNFRSHFCEESFVFGRKGPEKIIGGDGIQDGISEKFKAFIIDL